MSTAPLSSILIVGGGSAGWMAAAYLSRMLRRQRVAVTLVESPDIGTIGVGESTIPSMVRFVRSLGLDEAEFMRRCSGSYKLAIRFSDWLETGTDYWHPFGPVGPRVAGNDLFHYWFARREAGTRPPPYPEHSLQYWLAAGMKGPRSLNGGSTISEQGGYAFHVDAGALAAYLREIAISEGVTHIQGQVGKVDLGPDGSVAAVDIGGGRTLSADLYIDCTGFRGVLIEGALGDQWIDWNNQMLNDRAVVMPVTRGDVVPSYTHSTAIPEEAGCADRAVFAGGYGPMHSSAHLDETRAAEILVERVGPRRSRLADPGCCACASVDEASSG
ncbi:MAG: tryptophan 7-halogenase [Devosia sp.]|nr:tryptophan 7-halogenase [Devosia sp.]